MNILGFEIKRAAPRPSFEEEWAAVPRYKLFPDCPERLLTTAVRLALERHPVGIFKAPDGTVIIVSEDKWMRDAFIRTFAPDGAPLAWIQMLEGGTIRQAADRRIVDEIDGPRWELILDGFNTQMGPPPEQTLSTVEEANLIAMLLNGTPLELQDTVRYRQTGYVFRNM